MPVSFADEIKPLFRQIDVDHMKAYGVSLDDYAYMFDATNGYENANGALKVLTAKSMPPGGPFWTPDQLNLFSKLMTDGYQP
jgi:hypothetical protein